MRIFFVQISKNLVMIYMIGLLVLSYRLVINQFYSDIYREVEAGTGDEYYVYPSGEIVGIYTQSNGIFVIDICEIETSEGEYVAPAKDHVKTGDYILEINGETLESKEEMKRIVRKNKGNTLTLLISRDNELIYEEVTPVFGKKGYCLLGIWVKDDLAGVGTVTYVTPEGEFAALGHGMGNGETNELLDVKSGDLYISNIVGIEKGKKGDPGEIRGIIAYDSMNHIGNVSENSGKGIYGKLDVEDKGKYIQSNAVELAGKEEVEIGAAQIISEVSGKKEYYDIEITYVDYLAVNSNKGIHIEVVDEDLIELTGGIIQGMSGSPIIQNGKLVGAVTHVLINEPTCGYAIFIENMVD